MTAYRFVLPAAFVLAGAAVAMTAAPSRQAAAFVVGRVLDTHGQALDSTVVSVRTYGGVQKDQVRSNPNGDFVLRDIPPGTWYFSATRDGYELFPPTGREIRIAEGERIATVTLRMARQAVIAGTVTDEHGDPVVGAAVRIQSVGPSGAWELGMTTVTDDRGRYRAWTLRAGPKLVSVQPTYVSAPEDAFDPGSLRDAQTAAAVRQRLSNLGLSSIDRASPSLTGVGGHVATATALPVGSIRRVGDRAQVFRPTFHQSGKVITLNAGDVAEGIDIQLQRVPAHAVSGRVESPSGSAAHLIVVLAAADLPAGRPQRQPLLAARTFTSIDGHFTFPVVPSGRYSIKVTQAPSPAPRLLPTATVTTGAGSVDVGSATPASAPPPRVIPDGDSFWADVPLSVGDADLSGLVVGLRRAVHVTGRIEFDGASTRPTPERMARVIVALWSDQSEYRSAVVESSGRFQSTGLAPGRYAVRISSTAGADPLLWYPRAITVNGRDLTNGFIDAAESDVGDVVLTLTDRVSSAKGVVRDARGQAAPEATVIIFPSDPSHRRAGLLGSWRVRRTTSDALGRFGFDALVAGEYLVAATHDDLSDRWSDPEMLASLEAGARRVRVAEGASVEIDTRVAGGAARVGTDDATAGSGPYAEDDGVDDRVSDDDQTAAGRAAGVLRGVVVPAAADAPDAGGTDPVRFATITLTPAGGGASVTTHADEAGRFALTAIPPGRYRVVASKAAHLAMEHGATKPGRPGVPIQIAAGAAVDVTLTLPRGGVITGRVVDDRGAPLVNAVVRALVLRSGPDGPSLAAAPGATPPESITDDRGEYRVYGLAPGDYFVGATPPLSVAVGRETTDEELAWVRAPSARQSVPPPPGATIAQAPAFFPAGNSVGGALAIRIGAGEERGGMDIRFQRHPVFAVTGTVVAASGQPSAGARLTLFPQGLGVPTTRQGSSSTPGLAYSGGGVVTVVASAQGGFDIRSLAPGAYRLMARGSRAGATTIDEWASMPIVVGGQDVTAVLVALQPAPSVTIRVSAASDLPAAAPAAMSFSLTPAQADLGLPSVAGIKPDDSGVAVVRGVIPGEYWIGVRGLPQPWLAASAASAGRDVLDSPLRVDAGESETTVAVALAPQLSLITGTFTDASGRAAPEYLVVVFPADRALWPAAGRRIRAVRPGTDGRFTIAALPPGDYRLAAVWDAEPDEWFDPTFLERLLPAAIAIPLGDGETRTQDIRAAGR